MKLTAFDAGKKLLCGDYSAYTPTGKAYFSKNRRIIKIPQIGSIVYFYSGSLGRVSHVGIVSKVVLSFGKYTITTIEGNTSSGTVFERNGGVVAEKQYTFSASEVGGTNRINCFCLPVFSDDTCLVEEFIASAKEWLQYIEKESNGTVEQLKDKRWNPGDKNYTYFGHWYGLNPAYWCQMFVSYVAYAACKSHQENEKSGWIKEDSNWLYFEHGESVKSRWLEVSDRWYVFDDAGHAITNSWFLSNGDWYYLGEDSAMLSSQWLKYKDKWYYLTSSGAMAKHAYVSYKDGEYCYLDDEGVWNSEYIKETELDDPIETVK